MNWNLLYKGLSKIIQGILYRSTGVVLAGLVAETGQYSLFDDPAEIEKMSRVYSAVDELSKRYGKHTIQHGSSLPTKTRHSMKVKRVMFR